MTHEEFDNQKWYKGLRASYDFTNGEYWVRSVNFQERLLGLVPYFLTIEEAANADANEIEWVRCEVCTLLSSEQSPEVSDTTDAEQNYRTPTK